MTTEIQEIRQSDMIIRGSEATAEVFSEHYKKNIRNKGCLHK